jgi:hypothetical protein
MVGPMLLLNITMTARKHLLVLSAKESQKNLLCASHAPIQGLSFPKIYLGTLNSNTNNKLVTLSFTQFNVENSKIEEQITSILAPSLQQHKHPQFRNPLLC